MKLPKVYEPKQYEPNIYGLWEASGSFKPSGKGTPYTVVMPPPNANGNLHIGHALTIALEDIMVRYYRMKGRDVLYVPGADHAGFETWVVYEKMLAKQGKSRFDFSREELYSQVWDFVEGQRGTMELQLRELGASASWEDLVFTLDKKVIGTVYGTFQKLWDDGLVYRGERIVNFCTFHQTSFADIEVEHKTEKSKLYKIAYPTMSRIGEMVVATSRPETMLGDTAVAVHPDDDRYKELIGTTVKLPLTDREIPIIADAAVDPAFGTGAVKVTPAHDPTDFAIGERHDLEIIQVIGFDGKMTEEAGAFSGVESLEARQKILSVLQSQELLRGEEEYEQTKGHCYKCGTVIQPLVKDQWFLKIQPLAAKAIEAIEAGEVSFTPASKGRLVVQYLKNLHDWNLSRQIPWGIPIPAFQNVHDHNDWIFDTRVNEPTIEVDGKTYRREEDTFDTWFSSGQWPFVVTEALNPASKLKKYYPTSLMETGQDLLDRWVARMVMLGLYATGEVPFKHVYMHGMVLDEKGQKMSKSKGNVINPQQVIDEYGSDALRIGIVSSRSAGQNQPYSPAKVTAGRNFCNKLWNMARYIEDVVGDQHTLKAPHPKTAADHWVVRQLSDAAAQIDKLLGDYRFGEAVEVVYHTIWDDVADWYLEASKQQQNPALLAWVLETMLKISHPFAPFVTETIWQTLSWEKQPLITAAWPKEAEYDAKKAGNFEQIQALVSEIRFVATELGPGRQTLVYEHDELIKSEKEVLLRLARLQEVRHEAKPKGLRLAVPGREAWLAIDEATIYEHQSKLENRLAECRAMIGRLQERLANETYVNSAPAAVVQQSRDQLEEQRHLEERLVNELKII